MKVCNHCKETKSLEYFGKNKRFPDNLNVTCKQCCNLYAAKIRNKPKIDVEFKVCTVCLNLLHNSEFTKNPSCKTGLNGKCKKCRKEVDKRYRCNPDVKIKHNTYCKTYNKNNREKLREYKRRYTPERKKKDCLFHLRSNISALIRVNLKNKGVIKKSYTEGILGISYPEFLIYLNSNKYGFKFGDETLDLDHITPVSSAKSEEEIKRLNHYTNFQLLPSIYNRGIKKDNPFNREHFENWLNKNT